MSSRLRRNTKYCIFQREGIASIDEVLLIAMAAIYDENDEMVKWKWMD